MYSAVSTLFYILCLITSTLSHRKVVSASHQILDSIFDGYNRNVRPVKNVSTPTVVFMDNGLRAILDTDEVNQIIRLKEWLRMFWTDEFLTWNPEEFDNITEIKVPRNMIWLPDITRIDLVEQAQFLDDDRSFVVVDNKGFVRHSVDQVIKVFCAYRITLFPFDQQNCSIHYEPWHSTIKEVLIELHPEPDTSNYRHSNEWDLISYSTRQSLIKYSSILSAPTVRIFYDVVIQRKPHYYVASYMLPCFIIIELSLLGLFSPSNDSGEHNEKVTMGLTSLLSMSVLLLMISENLPKTNEGLPILGFFVLMEICIGALATSTTVYLSHLQSGWRRNRGIPVILCRLQTWSLFQQKVQRKKSDGDLLAEEWRRTQSEYTAKFNKPPKYPTESKNSIVSQISNFEYNMRMISANLQRKTAQERLRLQWASAVERLASILLVFFLSVNIIFFVSTLTFGYLLVHRII